MNRRVSSIGRLKRFLTHLLRFPRRGARSVDCGSEREICLMLNMAETLELAAGFEQLSC